MNKKYSFDKVIKFENDNICPECKKQEVKYSKKPDGGWVYYYNCPNCNTDIQYQPSDMGQTLPSLESNAKTKEQLYCELTLRESATITQEEIKKVLKSLDDPDFLKNTMDFNELQRKSFEISKEAYKDDVMNTNSNKSVMSKQESFSCCGYVNIKGLMCRDCLGWKKAKFLTITKEENEKWHPNNAK